LAIPTPDLIPHGTSSSQRSLQDAVVAMRTYKGVLCIL
jgi:hypothetical protein